VKEANPGSTGNLVKNKVVECTDGEACDRARAATTPARSVAVCFNQIDPTERSAGEPRESQGEGEGYRAERPGAAGPHGSACAFVDGTLTVQLKKNGKPKSIPKTKLMIVAKGPKGTKPRTDEDEIVLKCLPRTTSCPTAAGTQPLP
jgi:hypothetical protein